MLDTAGPDGTGLVPHDAGEQFLIEPLSLPFMQRMMLVVILIGIVSGIMGAYVVTVDLKEKKFIPVSEWVEGN